MTDVGIDCAWERPDPKVAWDAGFRFASFYVSYDTTGKNITQAELDAWRAQGFEVCLNWEWYGDWAHDYSGGSVNGTQHAVEAVRQAMALGYPKGCTIPFSVDFQETNGQIAAVDDYTSATRAVCHAAGYRNGAYGGYWTLKQLFDAGLIDDGWQTYAWSGDGAGGTLWDPRAAVRQDQNDIIVGGMNVDHNTRVGQTYFMGGTSLPPVEDKMITFVPGPNNTVYACDGMFVRQVDDKEMADMKYIASLGAIQLWHNGDLWNGGLVPAFGVDIATLGGSGTPRPLTVNLTGTAQ